MSDYLVLVDIAAKQEYIFSSNKLKDMVGASEIIAKATDVEIIKENCKEFEFDKSKIKDGFSGGGNAYLFFDGLEIAREFIEKYSLYLLKTYPSLVPYLVPYEMSGDYKEDIRKAKAKLDKIRNSFYPLLLMINDIFNELKEFEKFDFSIVKYKNKIIAHANEYFILARLIIFFKCSWVYA